MPKFEKVIRKQAGGKGSAPTPKAGFFLGPSKIPIYNTTPVPGGIYSGTTPLPEGAETAGYDSGAPLYPDALYKWLAGKSESLPFGVKTLADINRSLAPKPPALGQVSVQPQADTSAVSEPSAGKADAGVKPAKTNQRSSRTPAGYSVDNKKIASMLMAAAKPSKDLSNLPGPQLPGLNQDAMINALVSGSMGRRRSDLSDLSGRLASMEELGFKKSAAPAPAGMSGMLASAEIPKTKAGMKKFMQEYGKFIALGAMAGAGGKGGQIAAPIIAALPGLIEMMKGRGKKKGGKEFAGYSEYDAMTKAHGGSMAKKSSGGDTPKKSEGGAIRKFKGGSMNTKDSMFTPKYKKGGDMPKGKAAGEMPQHKKMAMGKPTPQSTGQKFAKGGAAKYAGGGMCKGYGIAKKIRPTGPMN